MFNCLFSHLYPIVNFFVEAAFITFTCLGSSMVVNLLLLVLSPVTFPGAASLISGVFRSQGPGRCPSKSKSCSRK